MLNLRNLTLRLGGRALLDGAEASLAEGWRIGLVGRNGAGKSTLLAAIAGDLAPDAGAIEHPGRWRIGRLSQHAPDGPVCLIDTVLAADTERTALLAEAETATDGHRIADIHTRLADIDAHSAPARAATILAGLGFDEAAQQRPCSDFSGGWRMRVALAAALFARPDLLMLDEPSNHLDLEARLWLEGFLANYPGTLILVSHDRALLNGVVDHILHLEDRRLTLYAGDLDRFERTRAERRADQAARAERQAKQRAHMQAFVDRFRAKASKARQAQSRLKALEKMEVIEPVTEDSGIRFRFPAPEDLPPPLLTCQGASVGYGDRTVLANLDLRLDQDDRIGLLGANGNGKSTLIRLLAGRLSARGGTVHRPGKLRVGHFTQEQTETLDLDGTPFTHMARLMPEAPPAKVRARLGGFGFAQDKADVAVANLSGGERVRLVFALISHDAPHLLLLDEPTNHLDLDAREALIAAINDYAGAVVLVSHDPRLLDLTVDRLWLVADGTVNPFDGDLDDYRRWLLDQRRAERRAESGRDGGNRKAGRQAAAERRAALAPLRRAVRDADRDLERLTRDQTAAEAVLADPGLYDGPADAVVAAQRRLADIQAALAEVEGRWLAAHEALEAAETDT